VEIDTALAEVAIELRRGQRLAHAAERERTGCGCRARRRVHGE
jgi:hypothetical protein